MRENPYPGVNTHLNSFLQQDGGGWESFHAVMIMALFDLLDAALPPHYYALAEKSLQLSALTLDTNVQRNRPDVTVFRSSFFTPGTPKSPGIIAAPFAVLPLDLPSPVEEGVVRAIVIYHTHSSHTPGMPVTRLEVLSPANKPNGSYHHRYLENRRDVFRSGVNLVELDLLHQQRPIIDTIPAYGHDPEKSYPSLILVSIPFAENHDGYTEAYGTRILEPLPKINIPLQQPEIVPLDFNEVYQTSFRRFGRFAALTLDYADDPPNFDQYTPQDQKAISDFLEQVRTKFTSASE
jgi:hypothetical protein